MKRHGSLFLPSGLTPKAEKTVVNSPKFARAVRLKRLNELLESPDAIKLLKYRGSMATSADKSQDSININVLKAQQ